MEFRDCEEAIVICDGANYDDSLVYVGRLFVVGASDRHDTRDGHGWAVNSGHEEATKDDFVEVRVGAACDGKMCERDALLDQRT